MGGLTVWGGDFKRWRGGLRCGLLMVVLKVEGWIKVWGA